MPRPLSATPEFGDAFLRGAEAAHQVTSPEQFFLWLQLHLQRFVPHDLALCWSRGQRARTEGRVVVLERVPLPQELRLGLADPATLLWQRLIALWSHAQRPCEASLRTLPHLVGMRVDDALASGLAEAGFETLLLHAVSTADHNGPELMFAFSGRGRHLKGLDHDPLVALELWLPFLQLGWERAHGASPGRCAAEPSGEGFIELTIAQRRVLSAYREASSTEEIARDLGVSTRTVHGHMRDIQRKLGARNRLHAVAEAVARRLIA